MISPDQKRFVLFTSKGESIEFERFSKSPLIHAREYLEQGYISTIRTDGGYVLRKYKIIEVQVYGLFEPVES